MKISYYSWFCILAGFVLFLFSGFVYWVTGRELAPIVGLVGLTLLWVIGLQRDVYATKV